MLEKLQKKFDAELHGAQVAASNAAHASSMKVKALADSVANDQAGTSRSKEIGTGGRHVDSGQECKQQ